MMGNGRFSANMSGIDKWAVARSGDTATAVSGRPRWSRENY